MANKKAYIYDGVTQTPLYEHDCDCCDFLGVFEECDLYYCNQGGISPTVIVRFSDEGSDYTSGLVFNTELLNTAKTRAIYMLQAKIEELSTRNDKRN